MKLKTPSAQTIKGGNLVALTAQSGTTLAETPYFDLLSLIADMLDEIAEGADLYMIVGATSKRDSFTLCVKESGSPTTVYAGSLADLGTVAGSLL